MPPRRDRSAASHGQVPGGRALGRLQERLGYRFRDPGLLLVALTHRSFVYDESSASGEGDYERLEFLGDAVLGFVVAEILWKKDSTATEGVLTRRKQVVVRASTLARVSRDLGLGEALRLGRGEEQTGGREKRSLLADVFEAVLGAVFVDGGIRSARAFVRRHLGEGLRVAGEADSVSEDYKTRLQERIQSRLHVTPEYRIVSRSGPDHARKFRVEVFLENDVLGWGEGTSRKRAEQMAARMALRKLDEEDAST